MTLQTTPYWWDDGAPLPDLPTRPPEATELLIVGAGFIGSHVSRELLRRGWRVRGVDNFADLEITIDESDVFVVNLRGVQTIGDLKREVFKLLVIKLIRDEIDEETFNILKDELENE